MRFRRFLAIILLFILPLQSTLAAIDSCCNRSADQQVLDVHVAIDQTGEQESMRASGDEANCCTVCDYCNHTSVSFDATPEKPHGKGVTAPPVPHPELPIDSFIPEIPSPPDRA